VKRVGASKKGLALIDKKYKRGMPGTAPSLSVASEPLCWVVDFGRDSNSIGPASSGTPTSATPAKPGPERALAALRLPACLATQTFAIARSQAVWGDLPTREVNNKHLSVLRVFGRDGATTGKVRSERLWQALEPIWDSLLAVSSGQGTLAPEFQPIVAAIRALERARSLKSANEAGEFARPFFHDVPEARAFPQLGGKTPEERLELFDTIVKRLRAVSERDSYRRQSLSVLAGYLATVAAGGSPSLSLAEGISQDWPEITAWAYTVGGVGENVVWTSSFDGLGRLVARELMRPFRLDEAPACDFSADEGLVLADSMLSDPFVHLGIKQSSVATIALFPGVNITVQLRSAESQKQDVNRMPRQSEPIGSEVNALAALLADALWPHLRAKLERSIRQRDTGREFDAEPGPAKEGKGKRVQRDLPLRRD